MNWSNLFNIVKKIAGVVLPLLRRLFEPKEDWKAMQKIYKRLDITPQTVNLVSVRNDADPESGEWNDVMMIWGEGYLIKDLGTTDPGPYWTKHARKKWRVKGVFHLAPGYHPRFWKLGKHKGYNAFVQNDLAKGWRDFNENFVQDEKEKLTAYGRGINGHHGGNARKIGKYGGGCQVRQSVKAHEKAYKIAKDSGQQRFSYLLLDKKEVSKRFRTIKVA